MTTTPEPLTKTDIAAGILFLAFLLYIPSAVFLVLGTAPWVSFIQEGDIGFIAAAAGTITSIAVMFYSAAYIVWNE